VARFDCWANPISEDRDLFPVVLEIQSDFLYAFAERVVVPLAIPDAIPGMTNRFNPVIEVGGATYRLHPLGIAVFHRHDLRQHFGSARVHAMEVEMAVDMLLRGY
jgi:CcdB protein